MHFLYLRLLIWLFFLYRNKCELYASQVLKTETAQENGKNEKFNPSLVCEKTH